MTDGEAIARAERRFDTGDIGDTGDKGSQLRPVASPAAGDEPGTPGACFHVDDAGVWHEPEDGDAQWICSSLHVMALTRNGEGEAWGRLLEFPDEDGRWHRWACPMELLAGDGTEFRRILLSQGLRIAPGTKARNLLATYVQTARVHARAVCTDRTGWHGDVYVLPDDVVGERDERILLQTTGEPPKMRLWWSSNFGHRDRWFSCRLSLVDAGWQITQR